MDEGGLDMINRDPNSVNESLDVSTCSHMLVYIYWCIVINIGNEQSVYNSSLGL